MAHRPHLKLALGLDDGDADLAPTRGLTSSVSASATSRLSPNAAGVDWHRPASANAGHLSASSPHHLLPEMSFTSAFSLRNRRGKTLILPKLKSHVGAGVGVGVGGLHSAGVLSSSTTETSFSQFTSTRSSCYAETHLLSTSSGGVGGVGGGGVGGGGLFRRSVSSSTVTESSWTKQAFSHCSDLTCTS